MGDHDLTCDANEQAPPRLRNLTIDDLGWTREQALAIRAELNSFAEDWDDPKLDVYNHD